MATPKIIPPIEKLTCKATAIFRSQTGDFLSEAFELTIVDGVVTAIQALNAADLPAVAIGKASSSLWSQYRSQRATK